MTATPISAKTDVLLRHVNTAERWAEYDVAGHEVQLIFNTDELPLADVETFAKARLDGKKVKITIEAIED